MKLCFDGTAPAVNIIEKICAAIRNEGGRAFLVGGFVRDQVMAALHSGDQADTRLIAAPARDLDLEAYHIDAERLRGLLATFGRVDAVGEAFTVYKIGFGRGSNRLEIDVSLPRQESKTGYGHRGFTVTRSEEHTSELQSHSFISYAVFCLK